MATNTNVKGRGFVKRVRDKVKHKYVKDLECTVCGTSEDLELHHFYSVSQMCNKWLSKEGIKITADEQSLEYRDAFIAEHEDELVNKCATLCLKDHQKLHRIYGGKPALSTASKQERWVKKQKAKHELI